MKAPSTRVPWAEIRPLLDTGNAVSRATAVSGFRGVYGRAGHRPDPVGRPDRKLRPAPVAPSGYGLSGSNGNPADFQDAMPPAT